MALTAAQKRRAIKRMHKLHSDGQSLRSIARDLKLAPSTISQWAANEGLEFDRAQTTAATNARIADLLQWRTATILDMLPAADTAIRRMSEPITVLMRTGDGYEQVTLDQPRPEDLRNLATTAGIILDKVNTVLTQETISATSNPYAEMVKTIREFFASAQDDGYGASTEPIKPPAELEATPTEQKADR